MPYFVKPYSPTDLRLNRVSSMSCYMAKNKRKKTKFKQLKYTTNFDTLGRPVKHVYYFHKRWGWYRRLKAKLELYAMPVVTHSFEFSYHREGLLDTVTSVTQTPVDRDYNTETTQYRFAYNHANQLVYQGITRTKTYAIFIRTNPQDKIRQRFDFYLNIDSTGIVENILVVDTTGFAWQRNTKKYQKTLPVGRDYNALFFPQHRYSAKSDSVYTYNEKGQLIETNQYNYYAEFAERERIDLTQLSIYFTEFFYNAEGLLILEQDLDKERNVIYSKAWTYLDNSLLEEEWRDGELELFYIYTYH